MQLLRALKFERRTRSYDDVIHILVKEHKEPLFESMRGTLKGDWEIIDGLRDKHDRF